MNEEIWRDIKGYEGLYQVSSMGRVKSLERVDRLGRRVNEKILSPGKDGDGYLFVYLYKEGKPKKYTVHRLVLSTFSPVENMSELLVNHKDENKTNNHLSNLEWCTALYNNTYNGRHKKVGEKNSIPIAQLTLEGKLVKAWKSSYEPKREGGFNPSAIIPCCKNKYIREGNNIYKGFRWCYLYSYISKIDSRINKIILFDKEYLI